MGRQSAIPLPKAQCARTHGLFLYIHVDGGIHYEIVAIVIIRFAFAFVYCKKEGGRKCEDS